MKTLLNLLTVVFFPRKFREGTTTETPSIPPLNPPEETKRKPAWKRRLKRWLRSLGVAAALTASTVVPWTPPIGAQASVADAPAVTTTSAAEAFDDQLPDGFKPERVQFRGELVLSFEVIARTHVETEWGTFWNVTFRPKSLSFQTGVFSPAGREDFTLKYLSDEAAQNLVLGTTINASLYTTVPSQDADSQGAQ